MIRSALLILLAALLLAAPAEARPDQVASVAMLKKKAKSKKLTCKQVKRARNARRLSRSQRKRLAAARRRCAAAQRRKAAQKKSSSGGTAPGAPSTGGGSTAPGGATGTGGGGTGIPTPDPPGDYTVPLPESNPHALQVVSGEFWLNLSRSGVLSGPVRVEFNNAYAEDPHDLHLVREDGSGQSYAFGQLEAGQIDAKTLDLSKGTWQLFCALPQHASYGMTATLKVTD